ncbi:RHS repeat-associated core domain-containing protein [Flexivirga caeni]|uniref:RHS repeat-associated core domain-containing protein n=1 Tax=Flexivirga caeni TaxID=2294115 RepID=UPI0013157655|nr:RHS repeat-associated core domain-containing protein [Flexivirga caeni]
MPPYKKRARKLPVRERCNDGDGNPLIEQDPTKTVAYLPGEDVTVTGSGTGATVTRVERHYTFDGIQIGLRDNGVLSYLETNAQGTVIAAYQPPTSGTGAGTTTRQFLDPYGNNLAATGPSPVSPVLPDDRGFLAHPTNTDTGLITLGARMYDPTLGAFTSVDPIQAPNDPAQWNGYTYAGNNPVTHADPTGAMYPPSDENGPYSYGCHNNCGWTPPEVHHYDYYYQHYYQPTENWAYNSTWNWIERNPGEWAADQARGARISAQILAPYEWAANRAVGHLPSAGTMYSNNPVAGGVMIGNSYRNYGDPDITRTTNSAPDMSLIRQLYRHAVFGSGGCAILCYSIAFQDGHIVVSGGGVGVIEKGFYAGYASDVPSGLSQSALAGGGDWIGGLASHGIDGNDGWEVDIFEGAGIQVGGQTSLAIPLTIPGTHINLLPQLP